MHQGFGIPEHNGVDILQQVALAGGAVQPVSAVDVARFDGDEGRNLPRELKLPRNKTDLGKRKRDKAPLSRKL